MTTKRRRDLNWRILNCPIRLDSLHLSSLVVPSFLWMIPSIVGGGTELSKISLLPQLSYYRHSTLASFPASGKMLSLASASSGIDAWSWTRRSKRPDKNRVGTWLATLGNKARQGVTVTKTPGEVVYRHYQTQPFLLSIIDSNKERGGPERCTC